MSKGSKTVVYPWMMEHRKMAKKDAWIRSKPITILERGLLNWCGHYGSVVNLIAGGYIIKDPIPHAYTGGVLHVDWVRGNLQETPLYLEKYFRELNVPWVYWSDKRHEPSDMQNRLEWSGLRLMDRVWGMSFNNEKLRAHVRQEKLHIALAHDLQDLDGFFNVFRKSQGYSEDFNNVCIDHLRHLGCAYNNFHHTAFYRGQAIAAGSLYKFADHGLIMHVGVDPDFQKRGAGTLLVEELLACAYAYRLATVIAFVGEKSASFFEKLGFEKEMSYDIYGGPQIQARFLQPSPYSKEAENN